MLDADGVSDIPESLTSLRFGQLGCPTDQHTPFCYVRSLSCEDAVPSTLYYGAALAPCEPLTDTATSWTDVFDTLFGGSDSFGSSGGMSSVWDPFPSGDSSIFGDESSGSGGDDAFGSVDPNDVVVSKHGSDEDKGGVTYTYVYSQPSRTLLDSFIARSRMLPCTMYNMSMKCHRCL